MMISLTPKIIHLRRYANVILVAVCLLAGVGRASGDLPPDWQEVALEVPTPDGKFYYWNATTNEIAWDHPSTLVTPATTTQQGTGSPGGARSPGRQPVVYSPVGHDRSSSPVGRGLNRLSSLGALKVGDRVEVNYRYSGRWYPATYKGKDSREDHDFLVTYDDTPKQILGVLQENIRLPTLAIGSASPAQSSRIRLGSPVTGSPVTQAAELEEKKTADPPAAANLVLRPRPTDKEELLEHWIEHDQGWLTDEHDNPDRVVWCMRKKPDHRYSKRDKKRLPMQDSFRFYSNDNQMLLESAYRNRVRKQPFSANCSRNSDKVRYMITDNFGAFGTVASQDRKYDMIRVSWDSDGPDGFDAILPESQRTDEFVLDRKLECVQTMRYGDFVFTILEQRIIDSLLSGRQPPSMTLEDWQDVDTLVQAFSKGNDRFCRARRNIPYEGQRPHQAHVLGAPTYTCDICYDEGPENAFAFLGCEHFMCVGCMGGHINAQVGIMNCARMTCPHRATVTCKHLISEQEVQDIMSSDDYDNYIVQMERHRERMAYATREKNVKSDAQFEEWKKQNAISTCPGCKSTVERSAGCNHITCTICATEFCYLCQGPYKNGKKYCDRVRPFPNGCGSFSCNGGLDARMQQHRNAGRSAFQVGAEVEGNYRGLGTWYPARIVRLEGPDTYRIRYDDGHETLHMGNMRVPRSPVADQLGIQL